MANAVLAAVRRDDLDKDGGGEEGTGGPTGGQTGGSPVKTVLGALGRRVPDPKVRPKEQGGAAGGAGGGFNKRGLRPPNDIVEVPFRRQDRRVLNARKKRVGDRKLIRCLASTGALLLLLGGACFALWWQLEDDEPQIFGPFIIIGSVLLVSGVMFLLFSTEVCSRLRKNARRVKDPEIDRMRNLHDVKHWVHPELIPYGWGQDEDEDNFRTYRETAAVAVSSRGARAAEAGGHAGGHINAENPHEDMALQMMGEAPRAEAEDDDVDGDGDDAIGSDIFDDSLRYSNVDRPTLKVDQSSPTRNEQRRGSFVDEDRIVNLFRSTKRP